MGPNSAAARAAARILVVLMDCSASRLRARRLGARLIVFGGVGRKSVSDVARSVFKRTRAGRDDSGNSRMNENGHQNEQHDDERDTNCYDVPHIVTGDPAADPVLVGFGDDRLFAHSALPLSPSP